MEKEKVVEVIEVKSVEENYFKILNGINVSDKTEKKNGLTYLSWAWAWGELKKNFPSSTYTIYENKDGLFYHTDGMTAWVKTGVTVNGIEHIEYLPIMDFKNQSIRIEKITSFDVNKAIQRSLTKAVARHGIGLYVYAGEDLPESDDPKVDLPTVDENGVSSKAKEEIAKARAKKEEKKVEPSPKVVEAKPLVDLPPLEEPQVLFSQEDIDDNATISSEDRDVIANLLNKLPMERQIAFLDKYLKVIKGYPSINSIQYKDFAEIKSQLEKAVAQKKA